MTRAILLVLLFLMAPFRCDPSGPQASTPGPVVLTHVTVIDMTGAAPLADRTVVLAGDRIAAVGPTGEIPLPQGAQVVDARGKFLIPGLWDMHVHFSEIERTFPLFLANGVAGVRNMGGNAKDVFRWRDEVASGRLLGPRVFGCGAYIAFRKRLFAREMELVGALHRAGVPILAGTDLVYAYTFAGFSLHDELELLVRAGLPPIAALQAATRSPADFFGELSRRGTVEPGKIADLVLLDADPLADITNTRRIRAVVVRGRYLPRETLDTMLAGAVARKGPG